MRSEMDGPDSLGCSDGPNVPNKIEPLIFDLTARKGWRETAQVSGVQTHGSLQCKARFEPRS